MGHELKVKSDDVDISILSELGPERFLIFSDDPTSTPSPYYKTDEHRRWKAKWVLEGIAFGLQFLPLDDPLVTGATMIGESKNEIETQSFAGNPKRSLWISIRNPKNKLIGSVRCLLGKGQSLEGLCKEHRILTADTFAIYRFSFPP